MVYRHTCNQTTRMHKLKLNKYLISVIFPLKMLNYVECYYPVLTLLGLFECFQSLCDKYSNVVFLEVDVDDCQDVAADCEVKCMPTFQFYKKGQKVGEFSGANKEKLEASITEYA
uniref:Thioredoxin domain-containing protein n=1 Tax=Mus spicilegus TaxID=10103 RepID=A0A8C6HIK2_MUSSI